MYASWLVLAALWLAVFVASVYVSLRLPAQMGIVDTIMTKICVYCGVDCTDDIYAYHLIRGPGAFQFSLQAIRPVSAINGEVVCILCYRVLACGYVF